MRRSPLAIFAVLGPGLAVAATGVGAGDVVAAAVSGSQYGTAVLWAALVGAFFKFVLNEGVARWQLATGTTLLEGWALHLHRFFLWGFGFYLVLWTFIVAGALIAACGLAAHAIVPGLSVTAWGILHSLVALALVLFGRYTLFERMMKLFITLMFSTVLVCAVLMRPDWASIARHLVIPSVPAGSAPFLLGVIGGVGGSVTLLSYSYWIREKGWEGPEFHGRSRLDLGAAYVLTGLFGIAIIVIAAGVEVERIKGAQMALAIAERVGVVVGPVGQWTFLIGFWGAVFTSMLGVWQGVPYLFADFAQAMRRPKDLAHTRIPVDTRSHFYRGYLLYIALPPMILLAVDRPVWIVILYSVSGAFFMPFLAGTLLYLNNQRAKLSESKNGAWANLGLVLALMLFAYLCGSELVRRL